MWEKCQTELVNVFWIQEEVFFVYILINSTRIQNLLTHSHWHFSYICEYKDSWWKQKTKPHFCQNRVSRASLPTQSSMYATKERRKLKEGKNLKMETIYNPSWKLCWPHYELVGSSNLHPESRSLENECFCLLNTPLLSRTRCKPPSHRYSRT